ncbi:MAG: alpha/beta hydrolase family protein [Caldimonas sp.]
MADFVLVHGAWHGAWCWRRVLPTLWSAGHRAFAVSLSGVGERAHLAPQSVTLDTHIADVAAVIEAEELREVILVGHSYAGVVITGVAQRSADRLRHLVYLDAIVPRPGESWSSGHSESTRSTRRHAIAGHGALPAPDPAIFGLAGADAAWVARRQTPHPGAVYDERLEFDAERIAKLPRTFISCTSPPLAAIDASRDRVRDEPGWNHIELATGHDAMISAPEPLLRALLALA